MNRIALVMIVRDEARSLERCLASARAVGRRDRRRSTPARVDATPEIARRLGARVGALRLDRRLRRRPQRRAGADRRALAPGARRRRMDQRRRRVARRAARARRPDSSARSASPALFDDGRRHASATRRAGCRGVLPRGVRYRRPGPRAARVARCRAGACRWSSAHDGYLDAQKATQGRPQRAAAARWRSRPRPTTPIFATSSARTSRCAARFDDARAALPARARRRDARRGLAPRPRRCGRSSR